MIKMKDLIKEIENGGVEYVSPEETDIDYYNDLNRIEVESGLYIYPWKHLSVIAIKNGRCVGGMYEGIIHNTFSFDVIVDKKERRQRIGATLIDIGISDYKEIADGGVEFELKVVNAHLIPHLEKRGLKIVEKTGQHILMKF